MHVGIRVRSPPMTLDPRKLNFGALAAERDITEGLKDYFVESESFKHFA